MAEQTRQNYRNFSEMMEIMREMRTVGITEDKMAKIIKPSKDAIITGESLVSKRTIKRICDAIVQWYGPERCYKDDETGKWHLEATDIPEKIEMDELKALHTVIQKIEKNNVLAQPLKSLNAKLTTRFEKILVNKNPGKKLKTLADAEMQRTAYFAFIGPHAIINDAPDVRNVLDDAIFRQEIIEFTYKNKKHVVRPLGIMYGPSNAYLVSQEVSLNDIDDFIEEPALYILENITDAKSTHKNFIKDNNFSIQKYANQFFGIYHDKKIYDVEWRVEKTSADAAQRFQFHPTQQITKNSDGTLTIKMRSGGLRAMATYIFQWAGDIVPVAPQELVDTYTQLLETCLDSVKKV